MNALSEAEVDRKLVDAIDEYRKAKDEMTTKGKPEGPNPPEGYGWVEKGQIVWPTDVFKGATSLVPVSRHVEWGTVAADFFLLRPKVTQPDLAWLKSKALEQAKLHPSGSIERERILWAVTEAVRAYSEALRALVPEREQWRPGQEAERLPARRIKMDQDEGGE